MARRRPSRAVIPRGFPKVPDIVRIGSSRWGASPGRSRASGCPRRRPSTGPLDEGDDVGGVEPAKDLEAGYLQIEAGFQAGHDPRERGHVDAQLVEWLQHRERVLPAERVPRDDSPHRGCGRLHESIFPSLAEAATTGWPLGALVTAE